MERRTIALLATIGLALTLLAARAPAASAQDAGSLIIGVSECPAGYDGQDYAADCTTPAEGIDFAIATPNTDNVEMTTSRGDGLVTFSLAPYDLNPDVPDPVNVGEAISGVDYVVFCTRNGEALDFAYETIDFEPGGPLLGISFEIEPIDEIACEWYNIPPASGDGDDDSGEQVGSLPNTGIGTGAATEAGRLGGRSWMAAALVLMAGAAIVMSRRLAA
jgi:hypothetical protein